MKQIEMSGVVGVVESTFQQESAPVGVKPRLRGIPDVVACVFAVPGAFLLTQHARAGSPSVAALVYGICLVMLFGVSATYHTFMWPMRVRMVLRRIDHTMVYVLIAGSYTPFCLTVLPAERGHLLLATVWGITAAGAVKSFVWPQAPRALNTLIYTGMGWLIVPFGADIYRALQPSGIALMAIGGAMYTIGAFIYLRRWPNPSPQVFGYHEVFHLLVVAAGTCYYVTFWNLLT